MNSRVVGFLQTYLSKHPNYLNSVLELWQNYFIRGFANPHFVTEFTSGERPRFFQRLWEMLLGAHFIGLGFQLTSPDHGPDLRFETGRLTIWVEAISPEPKGLPDHWMQDPVAGKSQAGLVPHDEILLRWTAAFKEKVLKLERYLADGIVKPEEAFVIAISGAQLGAMPLEHGISRLPYVVEAVLPVGPLAIAIDRDTGKVGDSHISERFKIFNANGAPVKTTPFVDPAYAAVSAVIGFSGDRLRGLGLPMYAVQNPLANVKIARGTFGPSVEEWWGVPVGTSGEFMDLEHSMVPDA
jgi:hypothetical protein